MKKLKYLSYSIVMQEVPNEISLAINISGCPYKCEGCHSKELWEYEGSYLLDDLPILLDKYDGLISCVCFMGGDQNPIELIQCLNITHQFNLKTCLYTGRDSIQSLSANGITSYLDYVKVGRYIKEVGGLNNHKTNQKFFKRVDGTLQNYTHLFWKGKKYND